jgi:hypothetical protein
MAAFMVVAAAAMLLLPHRGPETQILFKNSKYRCLVIFLSMKPMQKTHFT